MMTAAEKRAAATISVAGLEFWCSAPERSTVWAVKDGAYYLVKLPTGSSTKLRAWRTSTPLNTRYAGTPDLVA